MLAAGRVIGRSVEALHAGETTVSLFDAGFTDRQPLVVPAGHPGLPAEGFDCLAGDIAPHLLILGDYVSHMIGVASTSLGLGLGLAGDLGSGIAHCIPIVRRACLDRRWRRRPVPIRIFQSSQGGNW